MTEISWCDLEMRKIRNSDPHIQQTIADKSLQSQEIVDVFTESLWWQNAHHPNPSGPFWTLEKSNFGFRLTQMEEKQNTVVEELIGDQWFLIITSLKGSRDAHVFPWDIWG